MTSIDKYFSSADLRAVEAAVEDPQVAGDLTARATSQAHRGRGRSGGH